MTTTVHTAEIRRRGDSGRFDLVLDGEVFDHHLARQAAEVQTLLEGSNPLHQLMVPLYVETVVGVAEFNEYLADEADASRVRKADRQDLMLYHGLSYGVL